MSTLDPNDCILCDGTGIRYGAECQNCDGNGQIPPRFKTAEVRDGEPVLPMNTENLAGTDWISHHMDPDDAIELGQSLIDAGKNAKQ